MRRYLLAATAVVLLAVVVGAALCRFTSFNCHLHDTKHANSECSGGQCFMKQELALPSGFRSETVVSGLPLPTSFAFLPDGRTLIAEKNGKIRVLERGRLRPRAFLDISSRVNAYDVRGLLAVAPDPDFSTNGYVYVFYVRENPRTGQKGPKTARVSRFTAMGDVADPQSEKVVIGGDASNCGNFGRRTDCIPADGYHSGADIAFAPDGTMFVSTGDDGDPTRRLDPHSFRAQDLDSLAGKILHVSVSGAGLPGNPFWTGDPKANRSKVWAYGLRNPFRFGLRPGSSVPYVGDVGWWRWEEVDAAPRGANLGWPCFEGFERTVIYSKLQECKRFYAKGSSAYRKPLVVRRHGRADPEAVTGGAFYTGSSYPSTYRGRYFYGDYGSGSMWALRVGRGERLFARGLRGPVQFKVGPGGDIYVLSLSGELRRIVYTAKAKT